MESSSTEQAIAPTPTTSSRNESLDGKPAPKPKRRGLGSRRKAAERYRTHKNEKIGIPYMRSREQRFLAEFGITLESQFGSLAIENPITIPVQQVNISTHELATVASETVSTLVTACKLASDDIAEDVETVQLISSLQLDAKLYYASVGTPHKVIDHRRELLAERVVKNAPEALLPIASMLDNIGRVKHDEQVFIPFTTPVDGVLRSFAWSDLSNPQLVNRDQFRFLETELYTLDGQQVNRDFAFDTGVLGINGGQMYMVVNDVPVAVAAGYITAAGAVAVPMPPLLQPDIARYVEIRPTVNLPDIDLLFDRYHRLMARINKRVHNSKVVDLQLAAGTGTDAQLVYTGRWTHGQREVWSSRCVPSMSCFIAAAFCLGENEQPLHHEFCARVRSLVDSRHAISRLMRTLVEHK